MNQLNLKSLKAQFKYEWHLQIQDIRSVLYAGLLFLILLVFFPMTFNADLAQLKFFSPAIFWMAVLFSTLIHSERLFASEYQDGVLEQWLVSYPSIIAPVVIKIFMSWLIYVSILSFLSVLMLIFYHWSLHILWVAIISLWLATPALYLLCSFTAAFGIGMQQKGLLVALFTLPLTIPILIFASAVLYGIFLNQAIHAHLALLAAFSMLCMAGLPFAIATVLQEKY